MDLDCQLDEIFAYWLHTDRDDRDDREIVRDALGDGPKGKLAARQSDLVRELRENKRDFQAKRRMFVAACIRASDEFYELVDIIFRAEMAAAGYHYHRGEWRKRRFPKEKPAEVEQPASNHAKRPRPSAPPRRRPMPRRRRFEYRRGMVRTCRLLLPCRRCQSRFVQCSFDTNPFAANVVRSRQADRRCGIQGAGMGRHCRHGRGTQRMFQPAKAGQGKQPRPPPATVD